MTATGEVPDTSVVCWVEGFYNEFRFLDFNANIFSTESKRADSFWANFSPWKTKESQANVVFKVASRNTPKSQSCGYWATSSSAEIGSKFKRSFFCSDYCKQLSTPNWGTLLLLLLLQKFHTIHLGLYTTLTGWLSRLSMIFQCKHDCNHYYHLNLICWW